MSNAITRATRVLLAALAMVLSGAADARADPLDDPARDVWAWRAVQQPLSRDDIPWIERPAAQRWEMLGLRDAVDLIARQAASVPLQP